MDFEFIMGYGDKFINEDGSIKHYLHTWDDGERRLIRCKKCGAYFIRQDSEFHGFDDSDYMDWFQVESPNDAEKLNEMYNGWELEKNIIHQDYQILMVSIVGIKKNRILQRRTHLGSKSGCVLL